LHSELIAIVKSPEVQKSIVSQGMLVIADSPEEFREVIRKDIPRWAQFIKAAGVEK